MEGTPAAGPGSPPPEKPKPDTGTEYMVLELVEPDTSAEHLWMEVDTATASLREDAIKKVVGKREGTFKAVAMRSWKGATRTRVERVEKVQTEDVDL